ncbi:hypothetical protein DF185_09250 [Marinifilum breve]|uniref:Integrase catalytic domain-containing protein n=1 Tax=Marinifilum breve TaxID=2184082 RepID=A0A2V3ZY95_9BACT|nr:hypothetical protein DF185_09250 [Marinifilum breve]
MKNIVKLDNYYYPDELRDRIKEFVDYYNHERYHESLNKLALSDVYYDRDWVRLQQRSIIKNETMKRRRSINRKVAS